MDNGERLARYPFLPGMSAYLREKNISLQDIVSSPTFAQARDAGQQRVLEALRDGNISPGYPGSELEILMEMLSYLTARLIVSCVGDSRKIISRYALAEALRAQKLLETEPLDTVAGIARDLGLDVTTSRDGKVTIHFADYLRYTAQMHSEDWNLVHQELERGRVRIGKRRLARLLRNVVSGKIEGELPAEVNDTLTGAFSYAVDTIMGEWDKRDREIDKEVYGRVSFLRLPPCMKKMLDMSRKGQNVPHVGRFALTAFLHAIGMGNDDIVALFASSPDFKEQLARYQVDHITGKSSGVEYTPPECATMKSQGICFDPDSLCARPWMRHPLTYYRVKGKKRKGRKEDKVPHSSETTVT